jgi:hypothetical protein
MWLVRSVALRILCGARDIRFTKAGLVTIRRLSLRYRSVRQPAARKSPMISRTLRFAIAATLAIGYVGETLAQNTLDHLPISVQPANVITPAQTHAMDGGVTANGRTALQIDVGAAEKLGTHPQANIDSLEHFLAAHNSGHDHEITSCSTNSRARNNGTDLPTYTITSMEQSQTLITGHSIVYHLNVTASRGFSGTVNLTFCNSIEFDNLLLSSDNEPWSASLDVSRVTLTSGATVPVTLTIKTAINPNPMQRTIGIGIIGKTGAFEATWNGSLKIAEPSVPDYTLSVSSSSPQRTLPGASIIYKITVAPLATFTGDVTLTAFGLPEGTGAFDNCHLTFTKGSQSQTVSFTLITASSAVAGTYYILFTASSAYRLHDIYASLRVDGEQLHHMTTSR